MFNSSIYGMPAPTSGIGTGIVQTVFTEQAQIYMHKQAIIKQKCLLALIPWGLLILLFWNHINELDPIHNMF